MVKVVMHEDEDLDSLMRRFKRQVVNSKILEEFNKHTVFVKKSIARKMKSKEHQRQVNARKAKNRKRNAK